MLWCTQQRFRPRSSLDAPACLLQVHAKDFCHKSQWFLLMEQHHRALPCSCSSHHTLKDPGQQVLSETTTLPACSAAARTKGCLPGHAEGGQRGFQACGRRGSSHYPRAGAWRQCRHQAPHPRVQGEAVCAMSPPAVSLQAAGLIIFARDWSGLLLPSCWLLPIGCVVTPQGLGLSFVCTLLGHALVAPSFCTATNWQLQVQPAQVYGFLMPVCHSSAQAATSSSACFSLSRLCIDGCSRALLTPPACSCMF